MNGGKAIDLIIDPVKGCNLRCPTCPTGESPSKIESIKPDLLRRMLDKARSEMSIKSIGLYNFSEPLLHPHIDELCSIASEYSKVVRISTNLNREPYCGFETLACSGVTDIYISISGAWPHTYQRTHKNGDIDMVVRNLKKLASACVAGTPRILMIFHRYQHNRLDEVALKAVCRELGIRFYPVWAMRLGHEHQVAGEGSSLDSSLCFFWQKFLLPATHGWKECPLHSVLAMDHKGMVRVCCGSYSTQTLKLNYLETPLEKIQHLRWSSDECKKCFATDLPQMLSTPAPMVDSMAIARIPISELVMNKLKHRIKHWQNKLRW